METPIRSKCNWFLGKICKMSTTKILWIQQKSTYQLYFIWQCLDLPHAFPTPLLPLPPPVLQDSWAWSPTHPSNWFRFDSWLDISQVTPEQPRRIVIALQPACKHCPSACSICKKSNCFYFLLVLRWVSYSIYNYSDGTVLLVRAITYLLQSSSRRSTSGFLVWPCRVCSTAGRTSFTSSWSWSIFGWIENFWISCY